MRNWYSLGCVLAIAGLVTVGCDNGSGTDAGTTPTDGGGGGTDSGPMETPVVMAFDGTDMVAADLSCVGTATAPTAGAAMDFPGRAVARGATDMPAPAVTVQLFQSNTVPNEDDTCGAGCVEFVSDASGGGTVNLPEDGWFAYRILGTDTGPTTTATVVAYNQDTSLSSYDEGVSGAIEFSVISAGLFNGALVAGNVTAQSGTGSFTGYATDCAGNALVNVRLRVFGPSGEIVGGTSRTGPRFVYWAGGMALFPSATLEATTTRGRYAAGNIPFEDTIRIELWGRASASDTAETMIGCEEIGGAGDRVTLIDIGPARSDGPSGCSG